jgi:hypothetical protein
MARIFAILLYGSKTSIALMLIARIAAYDNGVGIFNAREKMIGWVPCPDETTAVLLVEMLNEVLNSGGRIKPDWSILEAK